MLQKISPIENSCILFREWNNSINNNSKKVMQLRKNINLYNIIQYE